MRVLQRQRTYRGFYVIHMKRFITRSWLILLWRLRSPTICCLQTRDPGKQVVWFSLMVKTWEPGALRAEYSCPNSSNQAGREEFFPLPILLLGPSADWICPPTLGWACCFTELQLKHCIHLNTPSQTHPVIMFGQTSGHPVIQSSWHGINHHKRMA